MGELRTSAEWYANLQKHYDIKILDADGWDRNNFDYSFNEEKIASDEFDRRLDRSTLLWNRDNDKDTKAILP
jgi:hypothetical protein